ncbi:DUF4229 domain-containing protein [Lysinibacter sp. HNR]|uniref:DUF4229 domain-containing protein n=1 Tax=Lysinibacter sp. HNR TaxID=3031408 RepID=UPI00243596BE|nr:DUF4229 domain-containing protein [Lysinibacter sp. HNR]WGD37803.1 DUF4229 domain-containing protein [Lysinibacter sp. HNR]
MTARKSWLLYTVIRLAFFIVPLLILDALGFQLWLSAIVSTLIAVSLSIIFLRNARDNTSQSVYEWRNRDRTADDIAEDEILDDALAPADTKTQPPAENPEANKR